MLVGDPKGFLHFEREAPVRRPVMLRVHDWREVYEPFGAESSSSAGPDNRWATRRAF